MLALVLAASTVEKMTIVVVQFIVGGSCVDITITVIAKMCEPGNFAKAWNTLVVCQVHDVEEPSSLLLSLVASHPSPSSCLVFGALQSCSGRL